MGRVNLRRVTDFAEPESAAPTPASPTENSRYGVDQRTNMPALAAALGIAALALSAMAAGQSIVQKTKVTHLNILSIEAPPPPPPPQPKPEVQPAPKAPQLIVPPTPLPPPVEAPRVDAVVSADIPPPPAPVQAPPLRIAPSTAPAAAPPPPTTENVGDLSSTMISATPPRYPKESRRLREQGVVLLRLLLGTDGRVADISVAKSSGHPRLDQAALSAVRRWRWSPAIRGGVAVQIKGLVEIPFILQEKG